MRLIFGKNLKNNAGFTLIEVIIAVVLMAGLSALTAQTISRSLRDKVKIQGNMDNDAKLQNALRLMERDIQLAYHHRDLAYELEKAVKESLNSQNTGTPPNNNSAANFELREPAKPTHFIGNETSMHFVNLNHVRLMKDSQESDLQEVGYYIEKCIPRSGGSSVDCLWRRTSPYLDDDVQVGGNAIVLVEDVVQFKLRYFGKGKQDWVTSWRTDEGGDAVTKNNFPQAVEMTLTIKAQEKESSISTVIPLFFTNNPDQDGP